MIILQSLLVYFIAIVHSLPPIRSSFHATRYLEVFLYPKTEFYITRGSNQSWRLNPHAGIVWRLFSSWTCQMTVMALG